MSTKNNLAENEWTKAEKAPQVIAALSVSLGGLCTGTIVGWTGNISKDLENGNFNNIQINDGSLEWIGSLINIGGMLSCIVIGPMCDFFGRKLGMLLLVIPFTLGWLLVIYAKNIEMIYAGRLMGGFAGGCFCLSAPLYISEISQKQIRGALSTLSELLLVIGILIAFIIGYMVGAKTTAIVLATLPLIFFLVFLTQPETPYYLLKHDREDVALKNLQRLRGKSYDVFKELKQIQRDIEEEKVHELPLFQSFKKKETRMATFLSIGLMFFQQASGSAAFETYTSSFFHEAHINESVLSSEASTIVIGALPILSNCISIILIDRLGRRTLLVISGFFMAITEILLAIYFTFREREVISSETLRIFQFVPLICLGIFIISFEIGYGPVAWISSSEMFPTEVRSLLTAGTGAFSWFMAFLITKFYLNMNDSLGIDVTFYIFAAIMVAGTAFPYLFLPETKGKSLVEIQRDLRK
ncbi:facilitated trehalose transporter Tret1-like [Agrilus planipennis]|uniref:Facilitated trehalose transporter Tret1-like n=1 Tax=Agrilus planipennis TaxID=224129 RepID=A0A1W4WPV3_AGRPL|nr:facilitated trehalose transporter Tret1-like [Agrilus planipennis]